MATDTLDLALPNLDSAFAIRLVELGAVVGAESALDAGFLKAMLVGEHSQR